MHQRTRLTERIAGNNNSKLVKLVSLRKPISNVYCMCAWHNATNLASWLSSLTANHSACFLLWYALCTVHPANWNVSLLSIMCVPKWNVRASNDYDKILGQIDFSTLSSRIACDPKFAITARISLYSINIECMCWGFVLELLLLLHRQQMQQ